MLTPAAKLQIKIHLFLKSVQKVTLPEGQDDSVVLVSIEAGRILKTKNIPIRKQTDMKMNGAENPPIANSADPRAGPMISPTPESASTKPAALDMSSGKQLTIIE